MRQHLFFGSLGLVAILSMAVSVPTSAPPLEELALAATPPVDELVLAGFPVVTVNELVEGAQPRTIPIPHVSPERFENLIVEPTATCAIDFAVLGGAAASAVSPCRESSCTVRGAAIGDTCLASTTYGADDGGTVLPAESTLSCRVTAVNTALIKLCYQSTDAGSLDPGAGLFRVRIIH